MRSLVMAVCCFCFGSASANSGLEYPSMWICDEDRFNWYCDIPPDAEPADSAPEATVLSEEEEAVAALKALREDAERKRALAIIKPTPENLKRYIVAQEALMDRASVFSDVWRRVIWANPELNYQLRNPSNNAAIQVRDTQRNRARQARRWPGSLASGGFSSSSARIARTAIAWRRP
jgi:conjugal transfer pilus assembly protein TraF